MNGEQEFRIGDQVELIMGPDGKVFKGILTDWDSVAMYVNGLGFPVETILAMKPYNGISSTGC